MIVWANLIVATGHNNIAISRNVDECARHYITRRRDDRRHAQSRAGGAARLRSVPELLDACRMASTPSTCSCWPRTGRVLDSVRT